MSFKFMAAVTIYSILDPKKIKSATVSTVSPSICHEVSGNSVRLYFGGALKSLQMVIAAMKLKDACSLVEKL